MGEADTAVATPPTKGELSVASKQIFEAIINHFKYQLKRGQLGLADSVFEEAIHKITNGYGISGKVDAIIDLAEKAAATTVSKHLARIARAPDSYKAFCPKCGRHYRYHNQYTGECPDTPFDADGHDE